MLTRTRRIIRGSGTFLIPLPPDWVRSRGLVPGDEVELSYDGIVRIRPLKVKAASATRSNPGGPAQRPAQLAATDDGGIVSVGS